MINGVIAIGALCRQRTLTQSTQSHGALRRICSSVGGAVAGSRGMPGNLRWLASKRSRYRLLCGEPRDAYI
jgi:hypothetical protein